MLGALVVSQVCSADLEPLYLSSVYYYYYFQRVQALWREFLAFLVAIDYAWDALVVNQVSSL